MRITFLGTGAGEGYPGLWCQCPNCTYARKHGGKNIRTNSSALVDDHLMIDISHGCFDVAAIKGIDLSQTTTLLITHPHEDHMYPKHLLWRKAIEENCDLSLTERISKGGPRLTSIPHLNIYGNAFTEARINSYLKDNYEQKNVSLEALGITFFRIEEGVSFEADGYRVTPVRGNHARPGFSHGYILEKEGKTLLYALDSGRYAPEMLELLSRFRYDLVVMEGTTGLNDQKGGHMSLEGNKEMLRFFRERGCYTNESRFFLTHMSPHWCPPHDAYESIAAREGMMLAYDGLSIEV